MFLLGFLYAFGELVEDVHSMRNKEGTTAQARNETSTDKGVMYVKNREYGGKTTNTPKAAITHKWLCDGCKKMRTQTPCEHCGKE